MPKSDIPEILEENGLSYLLDDTFEKYEAEKAKAYSMGEAHQALHQAVSIQKNNLNFDTLQEEEIKQEVEELAKCFLPAQRAEIMAAFAGKEKEEMRILAKSFYKNLKRSMEAYEDEFAEFERASSLPVTSRASTSSLSDPDTSLGSSFSGTAARLASLSTTSSTLPASVAPPGPGLAVPPSTVPSAVPSTLLLSTPHSPGAKTAPSRVTAANPADLSLSEIKTKLEEAVAAHNDEATDSANEVQWTITEVGNSLNIKSSAGEQVGVVEQKSDNSLEYRFSKDIDPNTADIVLRASVGNELTLKSNSMNDIKSILEAANTPPNDSGPNKKIITLDEGTRQFLEKEMQRDATQVPQIIKEKLAEVPEPTTPATRPRASGSHS